MPEQSLNLALAGNEVIKAILNKIGDHLRRDCHLSPTTAYERFECEVSIKLRCRDIGRIAEVNAEVEVEGGTIPPEAENDDQYLDQAESQFSIISANPNETRVETDQPVPTLTSKNGKQEIVGVKYAKRKAKN